MLLRSVGISDVGRRRKVNEDSYMLDDTLGLYIVADGVGGQAKGEVASAQAVEEAHGFVQGGHGAIRQYIDSPSKEGLSALRRLLESAIQSACYMVFGLAELDPQHRGMSTTMSALLVIDGIAIVAQVGDSRVYRLRRGSAQQLTEDHTLVNYKLKRGMITAEQAKHSRGKNVITRAVGHRDYVQVDTLACNVHPEDRFLLCSDGLHTYLNDSEVSELLAAGDLDAVARSLVDLANRRGGKDNITALVVEALPIPDEP